MLRRAVGAEDEDEGAELSAAATATLPAVPDRIATARRRAEQREEKPADDDETSVDTKVEDTRYDTSQRSPVPVGEPVTVPHGFYDMGDEFARGGLGRILKAHDRRLDRVVAIKELINPKESAQARFEREVKITAKLQHPNIIAVHEAGRWPSGKDFYAMKLVDGKSLADVIDQSGSFADSVKILPAVVDVAEAIGYAHSQGIIHRDLKPANVLVGPFGETVVIDWGLAKDLSGDVDDPAPMSADSAPLGAFRTSQGRILGTPAYMPPEQAAGASVDETADVYALGALLYHVLAGHPPYVDLGKGDFVKRVIKGPPTPVAERAPDTPKDLVAIVEKAMARARQDRYPNAGAMAEELRRYTTGGLVGAYRYGALDLFKRFVRRNRAAVIVGAVALVGLAAFGAYSVIRIQGERDIALQNEKEAVAARHVSERRVEELKVKQARLLLDRDPTASVLELLQLRGLDSGGPQVPPGAATVAGRAADRGVARRVLRAHTAVVHALSFAPDGRSVVSAGEDKWVRVWNLERGDTTSLRGHGEKITVLSRAARADVFASASHDGTVRVWRPGSTEARVLSGHRAAVTAIGISADGKRLASVSEDGTMRVWEVATGRFRSRDAPVEREAFAELSADGAVLVTGSHDGALRIWNADEATHRTVAVPGGVTVAALSPDAKWIATGARDGGVALFSIDGSRRVMFEPHDDTVNAVAFTPDAKRVATVAGDGRVRLHDAATETSRTLSTHAARAVALAISSDGRMLASGSWDRTVHVHDLETGDARTLRGHGDVVSAVGFSSRGEKLASASWDKTVRVWDTTPRKARRVLWGHRAGEKAVAFSPDGESVVAGGHDNNVRLWDLKTGVAHVWSGHEDHVFRVVFSPKGDWVASSSDDRTVRLWKVSGGEPTVLEGHEADVEELAFSPDGRFLASAAEDDTARLWNVASGEARVLKHGHDVSAVAFSADGRTLATASRDNKVRLWNVPAGALQKEMDGGGEVRDLAFVPGTDRLAYAVGHVVALWTTSSSEVKTIDGVEGARRLTLSSDGKHLAVAGVAPRVWLCGIDDPDCGSPLEGHRGIVRDVAFADQNRALVTGCGDGRVLVWDVQTREHRVLEGHSGSVFDVAVSPDGKHVASASGDGTVRLWPVERAPEVSSLLGFLEPLTDERPEKRGE